MRRDPSRSASEDSLSKPTIAISEISSTNVETFLRLDFSPEMMVNPRELPSLSSPRSHHSTRPSSSTELSTWEETSPSRNPKERSPMLAAKLEDKNPTPKATLPSSRPPHSSSVDSPTTPLLNPSKDSSPRLAKWPPPVSSPTKKPARYFPFYSAKRIRIR